MSHVISYRDFSTFCALLAVRVDSSFSPTCCYIVGEGIVCSSAQLKVGRPKIVSRFIPVPVGAYELSQGGQVVMEDVVCPSNDDGVSDCSVDDGIIDCDITGKEYSHGCVEAIVEAARFDVGGSPSKLLSDIEEC